MGKTMSSLDDLHAVSPDPLSAPHAPYQLAHFTLLLIRKAAEVFHWMYSLLPHQNFSLTSPASKLVSPSF